MGITTDLEIDKIYPNVALLPLLTKKFRWLRDYRVAVVDVCDDGFTMDCFYVNMQGVADGPSYLINTCDGSLYGYYFFRDGKRIGDYVGRGMTGVYHFYSIINGRCYRPDGERYPLHCYCEYRGCLCSVCKIVTTLYRRLAHLDYITAYWIKSIDNSGEGPEIAYYPIRHISSLEKFSDIKIMNPPDIVS